jgi:predicted NAD-dependent protein-ADP-ribosyltransferase YbiA (DUF1768 family)
MMRQGRQRGTRLPTTLRSSADEQANIFTPKATRRPLLASRVPESFLLGREISETNWDTEEEGVVLSREVASMVG